MGVVATSAASSGRAQRTGLVEPVSDASLDRTAAELALTGADLSPGVLRRALRESGSDLVTARAKRVFSTEERNQWLASLTEAAEAPVCFGEAVTTSGRVVVAAERLGRLELDHATVAFRLAPGFREPYLVVRTRDGALRVAPTGGERFVLEEPPTTGPTELQLVATGPSGPRPVANLWVGPVARATVGGDDVGGRIEARRRRSGAASLRRNRRLDELAEAHAQTICEAGRIRHGGPGGDPETRLRRGGMRARVVGEVAARAATVAAALDAILDSPSHELTLVDRRFTDVGAGDSEDTDGHTCLVVLFAAWPQPVGR